MNWKRTVGLALLMPALPGAAALTDEMTSDGSQLCPAVADGVRVYADECGGSVTMHISLSGLEVQEALLYVGTSSDPVVVRDGTDVEILCDFDSFKVIPVKLVAGETERSVSIAHILRISGERVHLKIERGDPRVVEAALARRTLHFLKR